MPLPSLHIAEIPEEGIGLTCEVHPDELMLTPEDGHVRNGLSLEVMIVPSGNRIQVNGVLAGMFVRQCVRCLDEYDDVVELPFTVEFRHNLSLVRRRERPVRSESPRAVEYDMHEDEGVKPHLNEEPYVCVGDRLEFAEMLREQIILSTPMQPLCHERCLGLCPACGRNLNTGACGCPIEINKNPFAILQELRKKSQRTSDAERQGSRTSNSSEE